MARVRIGDLLIQAGLIDEFQLKAGLAHQKQWGGRLGDALIDLGAVDEMMLYKGLAHQLQMRLVSLEELETELTDKVLAATPRTLCEQHSVFPVALRGGELTLAVADPTNVAAVDDVQFRTGKTVRTVLAPQREIDWAIQRHYFNQRMPCPPPRTRRSSSATSQEEMQIIVRGGETVKVAAAQEGPVVQARGAAAAIPSEHFGAPITYGAPAQGSPEETEQVDADALRARLLRNEHIIENLITTFEKKGVLTRQEVTQRLLSVWR